MSHSLSVEQLGGIPTATTRQATAAARTIAAHARDTDDARLLLQALGLVADRRAPHSDYGQIAKPSRPVRPSHCVDCRRPLVSSNHPGDVPDGYSRYGGYGRCKACYERPRSAT